MPPPRTPAQWADEKRILPKGSAEPGRFRSSRAPWMIPFTAEAAGRKRRRVVGVMGSQTGKTDGLLNIAGQRLEDDPAPILYVGPTKSNVEKVIEPRVMKMLRSVPSLFEQLDKSKASSKTLKQIAGVSLRFAWAGSATEVASQDAALTQTDELDRMKANVKGEGSPLALIEGRLESHPDGVSVVTSTPTEGNVETYVDEFGQERWKVAAPSDVASPIWRLWQEGTRHEWAWPCPDCCEYFIPRSKYLWWPKDATAQQAKREARLVCPHCGVHIEDSAKGQMNARGVAIAPGERVTRDGIVEGRCEENDVYSLWVSGLCSSWRTFGERARALVEAQLSGDDERIKAVLNTRFGELYRVGGNDGPQAENVKQCKAPYAFGEMPAGVTDITCYVDVQKTRLYYSVRGWGDAMESWLLEAGELHGETEHDDVWELLAEFRDREFGNGLRIRRLGIDSGYRPGDKWRRPDNQVYAFCRRFRGWALATKGYQRLPKPLSPSLIDVTLAGKTYKAGLQLWRLDSDYFKSWVHARLSWPDTQPGGWHVPNDVTDDYCEQITAEARVVKPSGQVVWVRLRSANHYLDCEAGNAAMAQVLGLHRRRARKKPLAPGGGVDTPQSAARTTAQAARSQPSQPPARQSSGNPFQRRDQRGWPRR